MDYNKINPMKRLCILVFYDSEGIVHDYLLYYIEELLKVCDRFIFVANGCLQPESRNRIERYTQEIIVRENKGLDFGAYIDVLQNHLTLDECLMYDEIVFSNDTLFGPFVPFTQIFRIMQKRQCDYWGLTWGMSDCCYHIQTPLFVARGGRSISAVYDYLISRKHDLQGKDKSYIVGKCEIGLSAYMREMGFHLASFMPIMDNNIFQKPDIAISEYHFPFIKKRVFRLDQTARDRCVRALAYINAWFDYPVELIYEYINRSYGFRLICEEQEQIQNPE